MAETIEKIYCTDHAQDNTALISSMLANQGGRCNDVAMSLLANQNNNWNNNPFIWLVWMSMFRNGGFWGNEGYGVNAQAFNETQRQISNLQGQMLDNHNSDLIMSGIHGNDAAIKEASVRIGCDFNTLNLAVQGVRSAIDSVAAQNGFNAERVINAVNSGDCGVIQAVKDCCCSTQKAILEQGYQNQLANCQQTNALTNTMNTNHYNTIDRMRDLGNGISQGFSSTAYEAQRHTCDIINAINASQQRTADLLNSHWKDDLAGKLQDAKFEVSQLKQNQYIASILNGNVNNSFSCGC